MKVEYNQHEIIRLNSNLRVLQDEGVLTCVVAWFGGGGGGNTTNWM